MFRLSVAAITPWVRLRHATLLTGVALLTACAGCSRPTPAEILVGKWSGDTSRVGNVARAIELKQDAPDASSSMVIAAARVMGAIALTLSDDKRFELAWMGQNWKGEWIYDEARQELRLTFERPEAEADGGPEEAVDAAKESDPAKPKEWIGVLDMESRELELFMFGREPVDTMKAMEARKGSGSRDFG